MENLNTYKMESKRSIKNTLKGIFLLLLFPFLFSSCENPDKPESLDLDLDKPEDNLLAFVKTRASLDPEEVVYYWTGTVYSYIDGERGKALFGMKAYNIGKAEKVEGGYQLLTREVALYTDPKTGEILESWENPFTEEEVEVLHVWNDPVNQEFLLEGRFGPWMVNHSPVGESRICFNTDIFLVYPNPLPPSEYPLHSREDYYQAAELFQFYVDLEDLNDPGKRSVNSEISWARFSPFLPWMNMADRQGYLVYHCRGYKLKNGYSDVPEEVRAYIEDKKPEYAQAPEEFTRPNETSWTYFKKYINEKRASE